MKSFCNCVWVRIIISFSLPPVMYISTHTRTYTYIHTYIHTYVFVHIYTEADKQIANNLLLAGSIYVTAKKEAFITLKDHKENLKNKPSCRLINPCKREIGKNQHKKKKKKNTWKNSQRSQRKNQGWTNGKIQRIHWYGSVKLN